MVRIMVLCAFAVSACGLEVPPSEQTDVTADTQTDANDCVPYCVDNQVYACNATGQYVLAQTCTAAQVCLNGACQAAPKDVASDDGGDAAVVDTVTDSGPEDVTGETVADASPETVADTAPETVADTTPDADADAGPETIADGWTDTLEDAETFPDAEPETVADADAGPDTVTASGETCADPFVIPATATLPYTVTGDTSAMTSDMSSSTSCPGASGAYLGSMSSDAVYSFTAPADGVYTVTVTPESPQFDAAVYAFTDCTDLAGSCLGHNDVFYFTDKLPMVLTSGQTVFIVVDGYSNTGNIAGPYTLTLDGPCSPTCTTSQCGADSCGVAGGCAQCTGASICAVDQQCKGPDKAPGNVCQAPFDIADPGAYPADLSQATDTITIASGTCNQSQVGSGPEHVFRFVPPIAGTYTLRLESTFAAIAFVLESCGDTSTCVGFTQLAAHTGEVDLQADVPVYIVVEAGQQVADAPPPGPYTLVIEGP